MAKHTIFVCKSCVVSQTQPQYMSQRCGLYLLNQLRSIYHNWSLQSEFVIQKLDCLSGCDRPCLVAFSAPNKTTLMFGDLPPFTSAPSILKLGEQYHVSVDGIVPRHQQPEILKKGILARIPPLPQN